MTLRRKCVDLTALIKSEETLNERIARRTPLHNRPARGITSAQDAINHVIEIRMTMTPIIVILIIIPGEMIAKTLGRHFIPPHFLLRTFHGTSNGKGRILSIRLDVAKTHYHSPSS